MLTKKIFGIIIILLNLAGIGFLLYLFAMTWKEKLISSKESLGAEKSESPIKKKQPQIVNDDIIPEEDDLLKDIDLSDLDNLDLEDFE